MSIQLYVFWGLHEELAPTPDPEGVIRGLGCPFHLQRIFVDEVLVGFGVAPFVMYTPPQCLKEWIQELAPQLRLVVLAGALGSAVFLEAFHQLQVMPGAVIYHLP